MCGITGFIDFSRTMSRDELVTVSTRMSEALRHRGPDDRGVWVDDEHGLALGHRRLSILDLSPMGAQPMVSPSGRYVVTFNGEIYNFLGLRKELEPLLGGASLTFRGGSDTEVMLAAFDQWDLMRSLSRFNGMFAFALWDRDRLQLHLGRDRLGKKPLYYGRVNHTFFFASELKALREHPDFSPEINREALALFLKYNYVPGPYSIFRHVYKLLPGTVLTVDCDTGCVNGPVRFWSPSEVIERRKGAVFSGTEEQAANHLDGLLRDAVKLRMIADVPVGAFLSGGIDSSLVVALMQAQSDIPVRTFTIGFQEPPYDEAGYGKVIATHLGTVHTEQYVTPRDALELIPGLPAIYDEPFADSSALPMLVVSQLARKYVTVSLSGDGGDELFGGYPHHWYGPDLWKLIKWFPIGLRTYMANLLWALPSYTWDSFLERSQCLMPSRHDLGRLANKPHRLAQLLPSKDHIDLYENIVCHWKDPALLVLNLEACPPLIEKYFQGVKISDFSEKMMYWDLVTYLIDNNLTKVDRASMSVALEVRNPFLDYRVVEFARSLPRSMKIYGWKGKRLLRKVLAKYVPEHLFDRRKAGFGVPLDLWLRGPLRDWVESLLDERRIREEGFFDPVPIRRKWNEHLSGRRNHPYPLWGVLMFQAWLDFWRPKMPRSKSPSAVWLMKDEAK